MNIQNRLYILFCTIILVIMIGSIGYYVLFLGEYSLIDCLYMTIISITSVGYGEVIQISGNVPAQIYTMILLIFGMGIILYALSTLTAILIEGELSGILRIKKMDKIIQKLHGHYIVCGCGKTGRPLTQELLKNKESAVVIENDEECLNFCKTIIPDLLYIKGDSTDDLNLIAAGIQKASGIIITLPSDKDCLYITMTARLLNKKLRIISRMIKPGFENKFKMAGADKVVFPNVIGALRMAFEMIRPTAVNFLDIMLRSGGGNLRIHEIKISSSSYLVGQNLRNSRLKDKYNLLVVGARKKDGDIRFNPSPDEIIEPDTIFIVMGDVDNIAKLKNSI